MGRTGARLRLTAARLGVGTVLAVVAPTTAVAAGDAAAGREKARQCQVCHGLDGVGKTPDVPHIAGESEVYLARQLRSFRAGERQHEQMSIIAGGLSDEDIADLAAWYSGIAFSVQLPE